MAAVVGGAHRLIGLGLQRPSLSEGCAPLLREGLALPVKLPM